MSDTVIDRPASTIRASLVRDVDASGHNDVLLVSTDENGQAQLEAALNGASESSTKLRLKPEANGTGCRAVAAQLSPLAVDLGLASVDFLCSGNAPSEPAANAAPSTDEPAALDVTPPEPGSEIAQTHHFVFSLEAAPRVLLHVAANWDAQAESLASDLAITGTDVDSDGHGDVQIALQIPDATPERAITLTWLNRPSGLARERIEPEQTLTELAQSAMRAVDKKPQESLALAAQVLRLHALLCRESGTARLWVDEARGLSCGSSVAAGKAAAANAIGYAKTQAVLPALAARDALDAPGVSVDKKSRERVAEAISAILGDTNYRWQMGPTLRPPSAPSTRLSALGFIDDNTLLLRGPVAQAYDLTTRTVTPTGMSGSVVATDSANRFALTDIVRACDGYHVQVVPANGVVGGVVTGHSASEPLLQPEAAGVNEALPCSPTGRAKSDHGGFVLLGLNTAGAVFARGPNLHILPLDSQGNAAGTGRILTGNEPLENLNNPGPLDQTNRYFSLATSEGVALVDRAVKTAKLVRRPASCAGGQVSDAALSPSGRKLAMLCGGHVYVAEPAANGG